MRRPLSRRTIPGHPERRREAQNQWRLRRGGRGGSFWFSVFTALIQLLFSSRHHTTFGVGQFFPRTECRAGSRIGSPHGKVSLVTSAATGGGDGLRNFARFTFPCGD